MVVIRDPRWTRLDCYESGQVNYILRGDGIYYYIVAD